MSEIKTRAVKITWVETGTNNAAMIGRDETINSSSPIDDIREAAEYHAECCGVDLERYSVVVEELEPDHVGA